MDQKKAQRLYDELRQARAVVFEDQKLTRKESNRLQRVDALYHLALTSAQRTVKRCTAALAKAGYPIGD